MEYNPCYDFLKLKDMIFTIKDTMTFGKYKGELIEEVWKKDMYYLRWCAEKVEFFEFKSPSSYESNKLHEEFFRRNPDKLHREYNSTINTNSYHGDRNSYADEYMEEGWGIPNH